MSKIYPTLEQFLADPNRDSVLRVKLSLRSVLGGFIVFIAALVVVVLVNVYAASGFEFTIAAKLVSVSPRWLAIIPVLILLEIIRRYHDDVYSFGQESITHIGGRLSLNYKVPSIRYAHIRAVVIKQSVLGRLLDYGDIELGTAAADGAEVVMKGIRAPDELGALVEELQHYNRDQSGLQNLAQEESMSDRTD